MDFGGVRAVNKFNMAVAPGELVGLIGPNGAGKTTVFNLITNAYQATDGQILMEGKNLRGLSPDRICRAGISRTFQNIRLFPFMTAYENVELSIHSAPQYSLFEAFVRLPPDAPQAPGIPGPRPTSCWRRSASRSTPTPGPGALPTGSSAAWRSPGRWRPTRASCSWTNRPRA